MSIDGSYKIVTRTPMGPQDGTLVVTTSGNVLTGKMVTGFGTVELSDGRVDGVNLSWKAAMKQPFPVVLECSAVVDGDNITGSAKAGAFGASPFAGTRIVG
jgi:hypothetical protein